MRDKRKVKTNISDFSFEMRGYGQYLVTCTSPTTGKRWSTLFTDMEIIDATKNAIEPRRKDLDNLKWMCKNDY